MPVPTWKGMKTWELGPTAVYGGDCLNANLPLNTGGDPQRERDCCELMEGQHF